MYRQYTFKVRSDMTPEEFAALYPAVLSWIQQTLAAHEHSAATVASKRLKRLLLYFPGELLVTTKVVAVARVPRPPLSRMGLQRFKDFEDRDYDGITYLNTIFLKHTAVSNEELYFHELIHVIQWRLLGPERFLRLYADGLERFGYPDSPLEKMAYNAQRKFSRSEQVLDAQRFVVQQLRKMSAL